jgi:hypothetical protein
MKKLVATLLAVSILTAATNSASAVQPVPGKTFATGHAGFWVGSIAINAVSLIACAMIVSRQSHRELNAKEVFWASLVPMGCLLVPR